MAIFKNAIGYVVVGFLPVAANFLLAPVYAHFMIPAEYAIVGLAALFQTFLTFSLSLSLDSAFSKIYFDVEKKEKIKHSVLGTMLLTVIAASALVTAVLFFTGNKLFSVAFSDPRFTFTNYGYWIILTTFSNVIFLFFVLLYRNEGKIKKFIAVNLLFFFIPVAGSLIGLIVFKAGPAGAIIGRAAASILFIAVLLTGYFLRHRPVFKKRYIITALKFSLPIIPYQIMFAAFSNIDRFVMEHNFTPHDFGVYNFAVMVTGIIPVFINAFGNATTPSIFRELSNKGSMELVRTYNYLSVFAGTAVIVICVACAVPAMSLLLSTQYSDSNIYIGTLFLSFIPYLHYLIYNVSLFYHGKTSSFPVIAFFSLAAGIAFDFYFVHSLGIWAVCLSLYFIRVIQGIGGYFFNVRFGFHRFSYIKHGTAIVGSLTIIFVYNIFLAFNLKYRFCSISVINLIPLLIFGILCLTVYKKECIFLINTAAKSFFRKPAKENHPMPSL